MFVNGRNKRNGGLLHKTIWSCRDAASRYELHGSMQTGWHEDLIEVLRELAEHCFQFSYYFEGFQYGKQSAGLGAEDFQSGARF